MQSIDSAIQRLLNWQGDPSNPYAIERKYKLLRHSFVFWFVCGTPISLLLTGDIPVAYRLLSVSITTVVFSCIYGLMRQRKDKLAIIVSLVAFALCIFYLQIVFGENCRAHRLIFSFTILLFSLYDRLKYVYSAMICLLLYSVSIYYHSQFHGLVEVQPNRFYDWYIGFVNLAFLTIHASFHANSFAYARKESAAKHHELAALNAALTTHQQALEKVNRELHQFASCASHDMREPLRTISSFSTLVKNRLPSEDKNQELLAFVTDAAKRMTVLLDDLISYTRVTQVEEQEVSWTDLNIVLDEVKKNLLLKIKETNATVDSMPLPAVLASKTHMVLLLQNLLSNSIKYASSDRPPHITIRWVRKDEGIVILVKDNGIGIEEKYINEIFEPFRRLHPIGKYEGSGIGLATCQKIVDTYQGSISATSEFGYSTTMVVDLQVEQRPSSLVKSEGGGILVLHEK
jgi:signal transduction histidine kinase